MTIESEIPATHGLFATPFYRVLAGHHNQCAELSAYLLARENAEHAHPDSPQASHSAVFESRFDLFSWQDEPIQSLKNLIYSHLMNYLADVNGYDKEALSKVQFRNESWYHITRKGGYFQPHTHPLASVSVIYCVDPGDTEIADQREAGHVLFSDPRHSALMYLDPANRHMQRPYSFDGLRFRLQADEICLFPSYLQHSVEPYRGERPRITVAANFSFSLK